MIGTISLQNLKVRCIVGILDEERNTEQDIFIDMDIDCDFARARESEKISDTLDYSELAETLDSFIRRRRFQLIETMAEECCALIFKKWPHLNKCRMHIKKPGAVPRADWAAVSIERTRSP